MQIIFRNLGSGDFYGLVTYDPANLQWRHLQDKALKEGMSQGERNTAIRIYDNNLSEVGVMKKLEKEYFLIIVSLFSLATKNSGYLLETQA
ncbi:hypothetical protein M514_05723 [Trichuris suis]|uniref:Uncharacterized protein n=1 Tax=Trichuris suis TaxID=68888 RepID=A0A085M8B3_9BILA|nr:hypothetical protein M513_05723 [Trichuris suis]KFD66490.1 hypothetical protein M514_05723 [Trichuris suis]